jgi:hypothetical protein
MLRRARFNLLVGERPHLLVVNSEHADQDGDLRGAARDFQFAVAAALGEGGRQVMP